MLFAYTLLILLAIFLVRTVVILSLDGDSDDNKDGVNELKDSFKVDEISQKGLSTDFEESAFNLPTSIPSERVVYESDTIHMEKYKTYPPSPFGLSEDYKDGKMKTMSFGIKQLRNKKSALY